MSLWSWIASSVSSSTPAYPQQRRVEDLLLGRRVQLKERGQASPHRRQHRGVRTPDLLQHREQPPLLVVVVKDQLGDIHASSSQPATLSFATGSVGMCMASSSASSSSRSAAVTGTWFAASDAASSMVSSPYSPPPSISSTISRVRAGIRSANLRGRLDARRAISFSSITFPLGS